MENLVWVTLALAVVTLLLLVWLAWRRNDDAAGQARHLALTDAVRTGSERLERELRDELGRSAQGINRRDGRAQGGRAQPGRDGKVFIVRHRRGQPQRRIV